MAGWPSIYPVPARCTGYEWAISPVSAHRPSEYVRNYLQNIMTEWTPLRVFAGIASQAVRLKKDHII